ncbi:MAG TPA: hypothetical protein ENJ71_03730, partial [Epsilonproteobacteria bacterium]|nr:hypothetical protein [Campylobacterota bacterium]
LAFFSGLPLAAALGISFVNTAEAGLALWLFRYFQLSRHLTHIRDLFGLLLMIVFVLQPFSALLGNTVLYFFGTAEHSTFWQNSFFWWFGNVIEQILFAPMLLILI